MSGGIHMHTNSVYLRADENMQISPLCLVLMDEKFEDGQVGLLNRVPVLLPKSRTVLSPGVLHLPIHFFPNNRTIKKELHIIPEVQQTPKEAMQLIDFIYKNPLVLKSIEEKLHNLSKRKELLSVVLDMYKNFKSNLAYDVIGNFTITTLSEQVYLVEQHGDIISNVGPFKLNNRGGNFSFNTTVATVYDRVAQTVQVNCKMYIFLDRDQLGYYFEFFLNNQNLLHQKIYDQLPDLLMNYHPFLEKALTVLETCTNEQPSVVEIIEKFRESL